MMVLVTNIPVVNGQLEVKEIFFVLMMCDVHILRLNNEMKDHDIGNTAPRAQRLRDDETLFGYVCSLTILFSRFLIFFSANWMACPIGVSISDGGDGVSFTAAAAAEAAAGAASTGTGFSLEVEVPGGFPEVSLLASEVVMMVSEGMTLVAARRGGEEGQQMRRNLISANKNASGGLVGKQQNERRVEEEGGRRRGGGCLSSKKNHTLRKNGKKMYFV